MAAEVMLEWVASTDWLEEKREQLADLPGLNGNGEATDEQHELHVGLAEAAKDCMEELPIRRPGTSRRKLPLEGKLFGVGVELTTHHRTEGYAVRYAPTLPSSIYADAGRKPRAAISPEAFSYARVVALDQETFEKRLFVPALAGGLALGDKVGEASYVGIESGGDPYITPRPLDCDFRHAFRLVQVDGEDTFPHYGRAKENVADLIEGLHAIAVSATVGRADPDFRQAMAGA